MREQLRPVWKPTSHAEEVRIGGATAATGDALGFRKIVPPDSPLAALVEAGADWDIPDADEARTLAVRAFPSTSLYFILQYRMPVWSLRTFGPSHHLHGNRRSMATRVRSGIVTAWADGPIGAVILRLWPEAAARLFGERMEAFADTKIGLDEIFGASKVSRLEEMVAEAPCRAARLSHVLNFLHENIREQASDPVVCRAAALLRRRPTLRVQQVAATLEVSERSLSRKFQTMFGMTPKQFARTARVESALVARGGGSAWADIAYACGFADQAHMIHDFRDILGAPPERILRPAPVGRFAAPVA